MFKICLLSPTATVEGVGNHNVSIKTVPTVVYHIILCLCQINQSEWRSVYYHINRCNMNHRTEHDILKNSRRYTSKTDWKNSF